MNAHNEQQPNEAVAWTVVGPDGKSSIGGWRDMGTLEFWKKMAVLREGHRYAYAAPVTEAQEAVGVDAYDDALDQLWKLAGGNDHPVYKRFLDFRDSFAAPVAAAQEAVGEVVEIVDGDTVAYRGVLYATFILSDHFAPGMKLYAAPVTAAPAMLNLANGVQLPLVADEVGYRIDPAYAQERTPAAPGLDLRSQMLRLAEKWEKQAAEHGVRQFTGNDHLLFANELRAQIDASPKGDDVAGILRLLLNERNYRTDGDLQTLADRCLHLSREDRDVIAMRGTVIEKLQQRIAKDSPKGGSEARDAVVVEGTVEFRRSSTSEPKLCVCCPGEPSHIFGRSVNWEGECWAQFNALETAIRKHFTYKNENEGRRLRVTIEVVQAQAGDAEVRP